MSLRTITLLSISVTLVALILTLSMILALALPSHFASLEAEQLQTDLQTVSAVLANDQQSLMITVEDWAAWDESYQFVEDGSPAFVMANLPDQTFLDLQLHVIGYMHRSGRLVFGRMVDLQYPSGAPLPDQFITQLRVWQTQSQQRSTSSAQSGLVRLPEGLLLFATHPIVTNNDQGPSRGTLVMGRWLDQDEVARLAEVIQQRLTVSLLDDLSPDVQTALQMAQADRTDRVVQPLNAEQVAGYLVLRDLNSEPVAIARIVQPRPIVQQGQTILFWLIGALITAGIVFSGVTLLLLERLVLEPLAQLDTEVAAIHKYSDIACPMRVCGHHELGRLATTINTTLSALRQAQRQLQASEARYRAIVEEQTELICRWRPDRTLTFTNTAYRHYFAALPEVDHETVIPAVVPEDRDRIRSYRTRVPGQTAEPLIEFRVMLPDGRMRWQQWVDRPVFDSEGHLVEIMSVGRDITEYKQADEERLRLERRALEARRLASLSMLAGEMADDYNHLMSVVLSNSGLLLHQVRDDLRLRSSLVQLNQAARQATDLAAQLLAYAGRGRLMVLPIDLRILVHDIASLLVVTMNPSITFEYQIDTTPLPILADGGQIRQLLMNLVNNAIESIGIEFGVIWISVGWYEADRESLDSMVLGESLPVGRYISLEVADTGYGMDRATQEQIFEPFFSTKLAAHGLGLSAVLGIVRAHGGALLVRSALEQGTFVRVLLPPTNMVLPEESQQRKASSWQGNGTVLVITDNVQAGASVAIMLRQFGFTSLYASQASKGVALFDEAPFGITCVLLSLSKEQNARILRMLRAIRPDLPIIILTSKRTVEEVELEDKDTLLRFLPRDITAASLETTLRDLLDQL